MAHRMVRGVAMTMQQPIRIRNTAEFLSHALALEREAAARYRELSRRMVDFGNRLTADLFERLACFEAEHAKQLEGKIVGMTLPALTASTSAWLDAEAPETTPLDSIFPEMTPLDALALALRCEHRAARFFGQVAATSENPNVRGIAAEMMREETEHVAWVEKAMAQAAG